MIRCPCCSGCLLTGSTEAFQTQERSFDGETSTTVTYTSCNDCGYTWKRPFPEGLDAYYSTSWQSPPRVQKDALRWVHITLRSNLLFPKSAIDVGARDTHFVDGLGCQDTRITDPCVDGGFVGSGNFKVEREYDLVCASHVMEHVPDPRTFMRDLASLAKMALFLEVPSPELETLDAENDDICRTHLHHFTLGSLIRLVRLSGFKILRADMCRGDGYLSNRVLASVEAPKGAEIMRLVQARRLQAYEEALWKIRACWPSSKYALYGKSDAYYKLCVADLHEGLKDYKVYDKYRGGLDGIREHEGVVITPRQAEVKNDIKADLDRQGIKWVDPWE